MHVLWVTCRYFITVADMSVKASILFVAYVSSQCDRLLTKHHVMN
jgi:hypothetical protein